MVGKAASSAIPSSTDGDFTAPAKIDVQKEVEKQNAEEEEALRRTVAEAIQEAHELERPARSDMQGALGTSEPPAALPNGYEQESQPNLTQ
jgi:hypothetical protein